MLGLTYLRNTYNFTLQELGDKLGVSNQTISKWEKGIKKIPQNRILQMSEEIFKGVPLDYYDKVLSVVEELEVEKYKIKKEHSNRVSYALQLKFDFDNPTNFLEEPLYYVDALNLEIEKETVFEELRVLLKDVTTEHDILLLRLKAFCRLLADYDELSELNKFFTDVEKLEDETLSTRAESWLSFFNMI